MPLGSFNILDKPGNVKKLLNMVNPTPEIKRLHETEIRVRYQETDAQGHVHHANYINYFEIGRVEMLRDGGVSYREFEESGLMLVIVSLKCDYFKPALYDDLLKLRTSVVKAKGVRIQHAYEIYRSNELIVKGETVVACVDHSGKPKALPKWLRLD